MASTRPHGSLVDLTRYAPPHVAALLVDDPRADPTAHVERVRAVAMFADVSGFTPISEAFAASGASGAEELTQLLNRYFTGVIAAVTQRGGTVAGFSGDAITALFSVEAGDADAVARAVAAAAAVHAATEPFAQVETSVGRFTLACKVGMALGDVVATAGGIPGSRLTSIVVGEPLDRAAKAEHAARPGDTILDQTVTRIAGAAGADVRPSAPGPRVVAVPEAGAADTLATFLHPAIAARIRSGRHRFVGEHRRVTVLFVGLDGLDVSGREVDELRRYVTDLTAVVSARDGYLLSVDAGDKGLKAIVLFGAPVAHEDDERRALRCAVELRHLRPEVRVRIGAATGTTFCGDVGGDERTCYTAIGDTVNVAARLMQLAGEGQVLLAGPAAAETEGAFGMTALDTVEVKGRAERVAPLLVEAEGSVQPPQGERRYHHPVVGRDPELAAAAALLGTLVEGHGGVLAITGEPGVGKSRLVAEIVRRAEGAGLRVDTGLNPSYGAAAPYLPWRGVLLHFLDLATDARADDVDRATPERLRPRAALMAPVLGLALPDSPSTEGLPPSLRDELLPSFVVDLLGARRTPVVVLIEDVHRMDEPSWDLAEAVARAAATRPLFLIVTARTEARQADPVSRLRAMPTFTELPLGPLDEVGVRRFLADRVGPLFGIDKVPQPLIDLAVRRAAGNAFFLEELLYLVRDRGVDPRDADALLSLELPDSIASVVLARLDALSEQDQSTIKVASVIGRRFSADWLWGADPELGSPDTVRASLGRLAELQLTLPVEGDEYLFRHAVVRDATYGSMSVALRRELHGDVGLFLEGKHSDDLAAVVDALAFHFGQSNDLVRQRRYFRQAADAARAAFANEAAVDWLARLEPLTEGTEAIAVRFDRGTVRELIGDWSLAESDFRDALERALGAGDGRLAADAGRELGYLLAHIGSLAEARDLLEQALEGSEKIGDTAGTKRGLEYLAFTAHDQADFDAALGFADRLLSLAETTTDDVAASMAWGQIGMVHFHRGGHDTALEAFERALASAEAAGDRRSVIHVCNDLAGLLVEMGDLVRAAEYVRRALATTREIGYRHPEGVLIGNAGELFRLQGDPEQAIACAAAGMTITAAMGDHTDVIAKCINLARALVDMDRSEDALTFSDVAVELARATGDTFMLPETLEQLAAVLLALDEREDAHAALDEAIVAATATGRDDLIARCKDLRESATSTPPPIIAVRALEPLVQDGVDLEVRLADALAVCRGVVDGLKVGAAQT